MISPLSLSRRRVASRGARARVLAAAETRPLSDPSLQVRLDDGTDLADVHGRVPCRALQRPARGADRGRLRASGGKNWCLSALAKNVRRSQRPPPFVAKSLHRRQVLPAGSLRDCHWPRDRVVRGRVRRSTRVRRLDPTRETLAWPSHFSCARARALSLSLSLSLARGTHRHERRPPGNTPPSSD